jgi:hypothetical protein
MRHFLIKRNPANIGWDLHDKDTGKRIYFKSFCFEYDATQFATQMAEREGVGHSVTVDCRNPK